jgi:hypothetical protein
MPRLTSQELLDHAKTLRATAEIAECARVVERFAWTI